MFEDFIEEMKRIQREINRSFGELWEKEFRALPSPKEESLAIRTPLADLVEKEKEIVATFELPGVDKKDIQLTVTENRIEVKAEKKQEAKVEKKGFYKEERRYAGFYRAMSLPTGVIPEKTKARYKDGVLEVIMPKAEDKKKNKIEIE